MGILNKRQQQVLVRAAEIIKDPKHWKKGWGNWHAAVPGRKIEEACPDYRICALGAVRAALLESGVSAYDYHSTAAIDEFRIAEALRGSLTGVISFNDSNTTRHEDIHNMFCEAIKKEVCEDQEEPTPSPDSK